MKQDAIIVGLFVALLTLVVVIVVYVPKRALAIPRSEDDIRRIVREEFERAKAGTRTGDDR